MNFKHTYWSSDQVELLYNAENPEQALIQPIITKMIQDLNPTHILDYGCGDAYMAKLLSPDIKVDLYDRNQKSLDKVFQSIERENCFKISSENEIPENLYDCIVLSFVLVCIDSEEEQARIIKKLRSALKKGSGTLIITNSHPCFLQYEFTAFNTSFEPSNFNYFKNGQPYDVSIKQPNNNPSVTFTDYQWQLSFWINLAIECGFELKKMIEVPDKSYKDLKENKLYPPFLILKFI
jgi:SAM-dependent methyltransferase